MKAYLKLDHIDKSFARGNQVSEVLKDIRLTIDKGEFVSIIGHSGCGKSTMLNLIAGLIPVSTGAVLLENREVNAPGPERAVVFQNHSLLPWLTVYENVNIAVSKVFGSSKSKAARHDWIMENLDLVQHRSGRHRHQAGDQIEQRGLAAAGMADDRNVFALLDRQVDVLQHLGGGIAAGEGLVDVIDLQIGLHDYVSFSLRRCRG